MTIRLLIELVIIGITLGAIYALMAMGLTYVYGITKVFNYAQGSFFTWSAYIAWFLSHERGLNYGLSIATTIAAMILFGLIFERIVIRPMRRLPDWRFTAIIVTLGVYFWTVYPWSHLAQNAKCFLYY
jgi:branched-chain amino acid transport system permease protein